MLVLKEGGGGWALRAYHTGAEPVVGPCALHDGIGIARAANILEEPVDDEGPVALSTARMDPFQVATWLLRLHE